MGNPQDPQGQMGLMAVLHMAGIAGAEKQKGRGVPEQSQAGAPSRGENCGLRLQTTDVFFLFDCLTSC